MRLFGRQSRLSLDRMEALTRLVAFGHALGRSLEWDGVAAAAAAHLPTLIRCGSPWVVAVSPSGLSVLLDSVSNPGAALAAAADAAEMHERGAYVRGRDVCLPLRVDGALVGVIGLPNSDISEIQTSLVHEAMGLLAGAMRNAARFEQVAEASARDPLTTCFTRRHGLDVIDAELRRSRRAQQRATLVMFDLDGFKRVNDDHGHLCGDRVLAGGEKEERPIVEHGGRGGELFLEIDLPARLAFDERQAVRRVAINLVGAAEYE